MNNAKGSCEIIMMLIIIIIIIIIKYLSTSVAPFILTTQSTLQIN